MDYGQKGQPANDAQAFFTAGVGNSAPEQNSFEPENNLDTTNQTTWSPDRNYRNLGNRAIFSPDYTPDDAFVSEPFAEDPIELNPRGLGEIVDITSSLATPMPPTAPSPSPSYAPEAIRTNGDHLSHTALDEIKQATEKLSQTGDIADFYTTIRGGEHTPGMMRTNLKNSYNREVA